MEILIGGTEQEGFTAFFASAAASLYLGHWPTSTEAIAEVSKRLVEGEPTVRLTIFDDEFEVLDEERKQQ